MYLTEILPEDRQIHTEFTHILLYDNLFYGIITTCIVYM